MGFSERQDALVKEAWAAMKDDLLAWSIYYFTKVVEIDPRAKGIFSFLKVGEEIPLDNPKLKAHAFNTFKMICESAIQLRDKGEIVVSGTTLKWLGSYHHKKGVLAPYFEVVKEASLRTVEKAMGEKWREDIKDAWVEAYDQLAGAIIAEMKEENEKTTIKAEMKEENEKTTIKAEMKEENGKTAIKVEMKEVKEKNEKTAIKAEMKEENGKIQI